MLMVTAMHQGNFKRELNFQDAGQLPTIGLRPFGVLISLNRHSYPPCQQTHGYLVTLSTTYDFLKTILYND